MAQEVLRPLTLYELKELLGVRPGVVLVAGQALAFWADYYQLVPAGALAAGVTRDIDFIGTAVQAELHALALSAKFPDKVTYDLATIDTPPPSVAVILLRGFDGAAEPIVIDYISSLIGYDVAAETKLKRHAVDVAIDGVELAVMHPFDCLKSRVHNLMRLPGKRNEFGLEQLRLAINVVRAYLLATEDGDHRAVALPAAEAVIRLAQSRDGVRVRREFGIDLLQAIPVAQFPEVFRTRRWPQVLEFMARRFGFANETE